METKDKIRLEIGKRFTRDLLSSPLGRAYVLTQAAVAEVPTKVRCLTGYCRSSMTRNCKKPSLPIKPMKSATR